MLTKADVYARLGQSTAEKGWQYHKKGRVGRISIDSLPDGSEVIMAYVGGSGSSPYQTRITLNPLTRDIDGICSCPVRFNCKHVAAALFMNLSFNTNAELAIMDAAAKYGEPVSEARTEADLAVRSWLVRLSASRPRVTSSAESLVYVLGTVSHSLEREFTVEKARRRKDGSWGSSQGYSNAWNVELGPGRPQFLRDDDVEVLSWMRALPRDIYGRGQLRGSIGAGLIRAAIATGRLHWGSVSGPVLTAADALEVQLDWQLLADGRVVLALTGLPKGAKVFLCNPPVYVDPVQGRLGDVRAPLPPEALRTLLEAPAVLPDVLERHLPGLQPVLEQYSLTTPPGVRVPQTRVVTPRPCLTFFSLSRDGGMSHRAVRLSFDYDGVEVAWHASDVQLKTQDANGTPLLIPRDQPSEAAAMARLGHFQPLQHVFESRDVPLSCWHELTLRTEVQWLDFLAGTLPSLETDGWDIRFDDSFSVDVIEAEAGDWYGDLRADGGGWFDIELGIEHEGRQIDLAQLLVQAVQGLRGDLTQGLKDDALPEYLWLHNGEALIRVPSERLRPLLEVVVELFRDRDRNTLRLSAIEAARVLGQSELHWQNGETLRELGRKLSHFDGLAPVSVAAGFRADLRGYQQQGLNWLQFLGDAGLGGVLADDMGLGKTIQTLAHLWTQKAAGRLTSPALVVCPTSLLPNWRWEAAQFTPDLRVVTLHGVQRKGFFDQLDDYDLILTSYALLPRDIEVLAAREFPVVIFDEAQNLKNPRSKMAEAAGQLRAGQRLALTGTPMENHLGELWSIFNLILPGYLGNAEEFRKFFRNPIEQQGQQERRAALVRRIKPFLLRRTKEQVTPELPAKTEIICKVALEGAQRDLYETIRASMNQKVTRLLAEKGLGRSHIEILEALLRLRQICCDPRLLSPAASGKRVETAKLTLLLEMLEELLAEGRKVLLFSQFTGMLKLIEEALVARKQDYVILTGETRDRATPVERFQRGEVPLFLISLKAGGVGLNLTAADCVIHYDPWWNPAVERQATDRAYRIGQDKPVFVYKLICEGTVEERMQALQASKAALADSVYGAEEALTGALSGEDIQALFQPLDA